MENLFIIAKADLKNLIKNPMWIFYGLIFPLLMIGVIGFLVKDNYGNGFKSYDYYSYTLMIYSILSSAMIASNSFLEERIKKANMRIIYAPGSDKYIYLSKIIATFIFSVVCHLIDMFILYLVFDIYISSVPELIILFILLELFSVSLGILCCCIFKEEQLTNQILSFIINIFGILGGLFFPLDGLGKAMRYISYISPAKWLSDLIFTIMYDNNFSEFYISTLVLSFLVVLVFVGCSKKFDREAFVC